MVNVLMVESTISSDEFVPERKDSSAGHQVSGSPVKIRFRNAAPEFLLPSPRFEMRKSSLRGPSADPIRIFRLENRFLFVE